MPFKEVQTSIKISRIFFSLWKSLKIYQVKPSLIKVPSIQYWDSIGHYLSQWSLQLCFEFENHIKSIEGSLYYRNCSKLLHWCWSKLLHSWQCIFCEYLQFSHSSNNPRDDIATEAYEDELDMGRSGSYLNSSINSAWSEHSLDPEDIRVHRTHLNKHLFSRTLLPTRKLQLACICFSLQISV